MNIVSGPGERMARGGLECLVIVKSEEMEVRLSVSIIILKKPPAITQIMPTDSSPPVRVLYWVC